MVNEFMRKFMKAKIIGIEPSAGYMDAIYEQTVKIELPSGKLMGLFDSLPKASSELVGKTKNIVILTFVPKIEKILKTKPIIEPFPEKPLDWKNHIFYGIIEQVGIKDVWHEGKFEYNNLVSVYVGEGNILVEFDKKTLNVIKKGDYIKVSALRSDLLDILNNE